MAMRVYYIPTHGCPRVRWTQGTLLDLQFMVQGFIEPVRIAELDEQKIVLLANEEGLLKGMDPNENLYPFFFVGPLVAVSYEEDYFTGLSDEQIEFMRKWLEDLQKD